jgi:hypothetical protein
VNKAVLRLLLLLVSFSLIPISSIAFAYDIAAIEQEEPEGVEEKPAEPVAEETEQATPVKSTPDAKIDAGRSKIKMTPPVSLFNQHQEDLQHYLNADKITSLQTDTESFIVLEQVGKTNNEKGVVILLPNWQQSSTSPKAIDHLRTSLPEQGWTTITMQALNKPDNYPSYAIEVAAQQKQNEEVLQTYKDTLSAMLTKVMDKAFEYPGIILMIAEGSNAAIVTELYQEKKNRLPNAMILMSAFMPTYAENQKFAEQIAKDELPILDILLTLDHRLVIENAKQRKSMAKKEMKVFYRQRQYNTYASGYYPKEKLVKEINGWLKAIGW